DVEAPGRLAGHQHLVLPAELTGQDDLLLVTAGQRAHRGLRRGRADVELLHPLGRVAGDGGQVEVDALGVRRLVVGVEDHVVGHREAADQAVFLPVLGDVGQARVQPLPGRGVGQVAVVQPQVTVRDRPQPDQRLHSSVCPLPCTPARPRISPARTWKDIPFTETRPVSSATIRFSTSSTTAPGLAASLLTLSWTFRPTIIAASSSSLADGDFWPTTAPRRSTVIVSAISWTSLSLCEMKTIEVPPSFSCLMMRNRSSASAGVSTAVGSSRISTDASLTSALMISTRCWMPTGRFSTRASGSTSSP